MHQKDLSRWTGFFVPVPQLKLIEKLRSRGLVNSWPNGKEFFKSAIGSDFRSHFWLIHLHRKTATRGEKIRGSRVQVVKGRVRHCSAIPDLVVFEYPYKFLVYSDLILM